MAALGKIRSWGVVLMVIIGGGLFAFIAEEAFRSCEASRNNQRQQVGQVLGENISIEEFSKLVDDVQQAMKLQGRDNLTEDQLNQVRDGVWQNYVQYKLIENECDKLGLTVTDGEMQNVLKEGTNQMLLSTPFVNRQTGRFDANQLAQFLAQYKQQQSANPQLAEQMDAIYKYWTYIEKTLREQLLIQKYQGLLAHCFLSNPIEAKMAFKEENEESRVQLAAYPYSSVEDSKVKITDSDLKAKYDELKGRFAQYVESRDIKYIDVPIVASAADRAALQKTFQDYAKQLAAAQDPTEVVRKSTSEVQYLGLPIGKEAYPQDLQARLDSMAVGQTYGPVENKADNTLNIIKLVAKQQLPDSVQLRAIQIQGATPEEAQTRADSVVNAIKGGADFPTVAKRYSQDGQQQWITTRMYEYSNTMDNDTRNYLTQIQTMTKNEVRALKTTMGQLVVQVTDSRSPITKYQAAVIKKPIDYSKDTRGLAYNKFSAFLSANQDAKSLLANAEKNGYKVQEAKDVTTSQHYLAGIRSTRDAMMWLFKAKKGDMSQMYEVGDNGNHLLVVVCQAIHPIGYRGLEDPQVKDMIRQEVIRDKKADQLMAKAKGVNSISAAKAKGALVTQVNQVTFAAPAFIQTTGASEPALSGAVTGAQKGKFMARPVKGLGGVYQFQVVDRKMNKAKFDEKTMEARLRQRAMQYAGNFMNELFIKGGVVDNRYLFF